MKAPRSILLVDDDALYRRELAAQLSDEITEVIAVESPSKAAAEVKKNPQRFQFAVIDQVLAKDPVGGIELCRHLVNLNRGLFALVFTNVPSDRDEVVAKYRYEALSAGAFRYLERSSPEGARIQVKAFVNEMTQLLKLRDWIARYYTERQNVPSLMTQLKIGVDIIDRSYKVWFMNDAMRRMVGLSALDLPRSACSGWHGLHFWPCFDCLVECSFNTSEASERLFLVTSPASRKAPVVLPERVGPANRRRARGNR